MKRMIFMFLMSLMSLQTVFASDDKAAHVGVSLGVTAASYTVCRTVLGGSKLACTVTSAVATLGMGVAKEMVDGQKNSTKEHLEDISANIAGVGAGIIFSLPF